MQGSALSAARWAWLAGALLVGLSSVVALGGCASRGADAPPGAPRRDGPLVPAAAG